MRVFVTGEKGFIGRNLKERMQLFDNFEFVTGENSTMIYHKPGEPCVHQNDIEEWKAFFARNRVDVIIHNAATVGTDVVALDSTNSTLTNVAGTYNISRAARQLDIPVCYMGTTVIYDAFKYQNEKITEASSYGPHTLYGCQKLAAEYIVKSHAPKWMIIRPLFAYGGKGDMNSLIAKSIYANLANKQVDMRLDPTKYKDYMHVSDYANAVLTGITQHLWNDEWNIAAETPHVTQNIIKMIEKICGLDMSNTINWKPASDYTGNHRLDSSKFRNATGWSPKIILTKGIRMSYEAILNSKDYNPLVHLEEAKKNKINVGEFFNEARIARKSI
mgnify:CR=1 FL=1